jgi:hypothetical protein
MPELERWVLHRLAELDAEGARGLRAYDFQGVFQALFNFATVDLSAFYFDIRKDALYCDGDTDRRRRGADGDGPAVPPADHVAGADPRLHHGGGLAGTLPGRGQLRAPAVDIPERPPSGATRRWPRNGSACARPAAW